MRRVSAAFLGSILLISGCRGQEAGADGPVHVVASFYPLAYAAQRVGGSLVQVTDLTPPGAEPHDLELTPDQLRSIATADVVLYLGGGFQPAVSDALGDATGRAIDVSNGLRSLPVPAGETEPSLSADPHVWLDPTIYSRIVGRIEVALADIDPQGRSRFASNARAFEDELARLDEAYREGLAHCARHEIVTSHAAFGYLAARYGLTQEAISGLTPDAEPTPRRLDDLRTLVEREGVTTIFTEELVSPKVAETLAHETGATTEVLSPLETLTPSETAAGQDYGSVMRDNLAKLQVALGCS
jgi:zinc transport system substrate-binding protein